MVYCGRPSRGCQTCKSRHIKCDEARPACSQCLRSGWQCPGYTDIVDLMFRDETSAIKRRIERGSRRGGRARSSRAERPKTTRPSVALPSPDPIHPPESVLTDRSLPTSADVTPSPPPQLSSPPEEDDDNITEIVPLISQASTPLPIYEISSPTEEALSPGTTDSLALATTRLSISAPSRTVYRTSRTTRTLIHSPEAYQILIHPNTNVQDVATTYFFEQFILPNLSHSQRSFLDHLVPAYLGSTRNSPLQHAAHAVAMCSLANYPTCRMLGTEAKKSYGKALRAVNQAMQDPVAVRTDETLMAVILFALYEEISSEHTTTTAWENHINGAVTLIKLRGQEIVKEPRSKTLFEFVRTFLISFCLQHDRSADDFPNFESWESLASEDTPPLPSAALGIISLSLPGLKVEAKRLIGEPRSRMNVIRLMECINSATVIETNLESWMRMLPKDWHPKTAFIQPAIPGDADPMEQTHWSGPVHVYGNTRQCFFWNTYRVNRLVTHSIISNCARALVGSELDATVKHTLAFSEYIMDRMVQDICSSALFNLDSTIQTMYPLSSDADVSARASGAYLVLWPLGSLLRFGSIGDERRKLWIIGRLIMVSEMYGLRRAKRLLLRAATHQAAQAAQSTDPAPTVSTRREVAV